MNRTTIALFLILAAVISCEREEDDFVWQFRQGSGRAYFIENTADSGFVSAGILNGKAYTMMNDRKGRKVFSYTSEYAGSYRSVWKDTSVYIVAGVSDSKLILGRLSNEGVLVWEKTVDTEGVVSNVFLFSRGEGEFSVVCSAGPEDITLTASKLSVVSFDTSGVISSQLDRDYLGLFAVTGIADRPDGSITLAVTKSYPGGKSDAYTVRIGSDLNTIWQKELITNPSYGGASLGLCRAPSDGVYVIGRTEYISGDELFTNTFISAVSSTGSVRWTSYPESSNEGAAVRLNESGVIYLLNKNCYIVNRLEDNQSNATDEGNIKVYAVCDSYDTDALADSFTINFDGNLLLAGSQSGSYFIALKNIPR